MEHELWSKPSPWLASAPSLRLLSWSLHLRLHLPLNGLFTRQLPSVGGILPLVLTTNEVIITIISVSAHLFMGYRVLFPSRSI
jgi:hypothetical protein